MTLEAFRARRAAGKREAILERASEAFRTEGYARASMDAVARAAQVSTATLYRYFESKAALFEAVAGATMDRLQLEIAETAEPAQELPRLAQAYARLLAQPETRGMFRMVVSESGRDAGLADRFYRAVKGRLSDLFAQAVRRGEAAGLYDTSLPPEQVAGQLQGMIEHATLMRGLVLGDEIDTLFNVEEIAKEAFATWLARWGRQPQARF